MTGNSHSRSGPSPRDDLHGVATASSMSITHRVLIDLRRSRDRLKSSKVRGGKIAGEGCSSFARTHRSDPKLLTHVEEVGEKLIAKNPALREKYAEFLVAARNNAKYDRVVELSRKVYPETAKHADDAVEAGLPRGLEIFRKGAKDNRKESLNGIPTKRGFDRDEYPPTMMKEGGSGASSLHYT